MLIRATKTISGPLTAPEGYPGKMTASHVSRQRKIPRWVDCDAREFIDRWLPKFESKQLAPCSEEEWNRIKQLLHMSG